MSELSDFIDNLTNKQLVSKELKKFSEPLKNPDLDIETIDSIEGLIASDIQLNLRNLSPLHSHLNGSTLANLEFVARNFTTEDDRPVDNKKLGRAIYKNVYLPLEKEAMQIKETEGVSEEALSDLIGRLSSKKPIVQALLRQSVQLHEDDNGEYEDDEEHEGTNLQAEVIQNIQRCISGGISLTLQTREGLRDNLNAETLNKLEILARNFFTENGQPVDATKLAETIYTDVYLPLQSKALEIDKAVVKASYNSTQSSMDNSKFDSSIQSGFVR